MRIYNNRREELNNSIKILHEEKQPLLVALSYDMSEEISYELFK